jgi:hypothetical protein
MIGTRARCTLKAEESDGESERAAVSSARRQRRPDADGVCKTKRLAKPPLRSTINPGRLACVGYFLPLNYPMLQKHALQHSPARARARAPAGASITTTTPRTVAVRRAPQQQRSSVAARAGADPERKGDAEESQQVRSPALIGSCDARHSRLCSSRAPPIIISLRLLPLNTTTTKQNRASRSTPPARAPPSPAPHGSRSSACSGAARG